MVGTPTPTPTPMGTPLFTFLLGCVEGGGEGEVTAGAGDNDTADVLLAAIFELEEVVTAEELLVVLLKLFVIDGLIVVKMVAGAKLKTCAESERLQPPKL